MFDLKMQEIRISNEGYVLCKSSFYEIGVSLSENYQYVLKNGANIINCEIDSPEVAISYLLSVRDKSKDNVLLYEKCVYVDNQKLPMNEILKHSCYLDETSSLFPKNRTVRHLICKGIKNSKLQLTVEQIVEKFKLTDRINKPLKANGNEKYRAMAAIAFAYGKGIFCFPWFSKKRFEYYEETIKYLLDILKSEEKIAILPISNAVKLENL